jgi:hypothetical protein
VLEPLEEVATNFSGSIGLKYEIEAVGEALSQGLLEHPLVTHDNSRLVMQIIEESNKQLGYII